MAGLSPFEEYLLPYEHKVIVEDATSYPPNGLHQGNGTIEEWRLVVYHHARP